MHAPLGWLYLAITKLGAAAVPINLILLGAALSRTPQQQELPALTAAAIVVARMVVMPVCGLAAARLLATINPQGIPYMVAGPLWLVCPILTFPSPRGLTPFLSSLAGGRPLLARLPHPHLHAHRQQHRRHVRPRGREPARHVGLHLLPGMCMACSNMYPLHVYTCAYS